MQLQDMMRTHKTMFQVRVERLLRKGIPVDRSERYRRGRPTPRKRFKVDLDSPGAQGGPETPVSANTSLGSSPKPAPSQAEMSRAANASPGSSRRPATSQTKCINSSQEGSSGPAVPSQTGSSTAGRLSQLRACHLTRLDTGTASQGGHVQSVPTASAQTPANQGRRA